MDLPKYKREFCCPVCGLIWFADYNGIVDVICPECKNSKHKGGIYACDTMAYAFGYNSIKYALEKMGKSIHYAKDHPNYNKK